MLFDYGEVQPVAFWMKNTKLPLDMLFIAEDGRIVGITPHAVPYCEALVPSPGPVRAVLELNAGTAERLGVAVGDEVVCAFPAPTPPPADPRPLHDLAGRWRMEAKERDAIVPNIVLALRPDGGLDLFRDDGGGTNFSLHFWGAWAPSSPAPGRVEISGCATAVTALCAHRLGADRAHARRLPTLRHRRPAPVRYAVRFER
jgi:hypothetical protein